MRIIDSAIKLFAERGFEYSLLTWATATLEVFYDFCFPSLFTHKTHNTFIQLIPTCKPT